MNKICSLCQKACKQMEAVKIMECKRYSPAPVQLVFKFKGQRKVSRDKCK